MNKVVGIRRPVVTALHRFASLNASSVDRDEVEKFKRLSADWWDENGKVRLLMRMNRLRVPFVRDGLLKTYKDKNKIGSAEEPLKGFRILDVGCGGGFFSEGLARLGARVTGLDLSDEMVSVANYHKSLDDKIANKIEYINSSIEDFQVNNANSFDAVVSSEVIEHVTNKTVFLKACVQTIKPGGSIFFTTLSRTLFTRIISIYLAENLNKIPPGTHEYGKLISSHQLQRHLEELGCTTLIINGIVLNLFTENWHWFPSKFLHYALHAVKKTE